MCENVNEGEEEEMANVSFCYFFLELYLFFNSLMVHASGVRYFARREITTHNLIFQPRSKRNYFSCYLQHLSQNYRLNLFSQRVEKWEIGSQHRRLGRAICTAL